MNVNCWSLPSLINKPPCPYYSCIAVFCLCLYLCARASGGLIVIARQASKCLCLCVFFFCKCYYRLLLAWHLITIRFVTWTVLEMGFFFCCQILFAPLCSDFSCLLFAAGCLALWPDVQAVLQRMCVTYLQRLTLNNLLWPLSTLSTRLCWDHSYADEDSGEI